MAPTITSPRASPTTKQRALSIGGLLEPWVAELAKHGHAKMRKMRSSQEAATIEFVFSALRDDHTTREDITALREALAVIHFAARVDLNDVEDALSELCYHDFDQPEDDDDDETDNVLHRTENHGDTDDDKAGLSFVLTFYGTSGRFLDQVIAPVLFSESYSPSEAFQSTMQALAFDSDLRCMPLRCRVHLVSMDGDFQDQAEDDYMELVVSFVRQICEDTNQLETNDHTTIRVTAIDLELNEMAITSDIATTTEQLQHTSIPVRCSRVALNPRELSCSTAELTSFLENLGAQSSEMTVEIGHLLLCEPTPSMEGNHQELIHKIFRGIAGSSRVTSVSFGPLLAMLVDPFNRKSLWTELFASLTSKCTKAKISSLVMSPQIELLEDDAVFIREAIAATNQKLRVRSVQMWLSQSSSAAVQAFIKAVASHAEEITLHTEAHAFTTKETVSCITTHCLQLRELTLTGAEIESMANFSEMEVPLRTLSLAAVTIKDSSESLGGFFASLADPTTELAKNLQQLHIKNVNSLPLSTLIGGTEAQVVAEMLTRNKTLRHLTLMMADGTPTTTMAAIHLHNREALAEPLALTQKLAFLSVVQPSANGDSNLHLHRYRVDQDVVQLIFDFAAGRVTRRVLLDW